MEEKRPNPVLLGQIAVALSGLMLATYGCRTSEPTSDATATSPGLESIQQRLSDVTKDLGVRIGQIEYWQDSGGVYETRKVELFDDGLRCTWSIEPKSVAHAAQFYFEPGTAEIQRIHTKGRDCLENDKCSPDYEYAQEVHGYAWPFEVKDEADADELGKRRARKIADWFSDNLDVEVSSVNWHGTSMTNDERQVTPVEPMGGAIIDDVSDFPRHTRQRGPALSEAQLSDLIQLREDVAMSRRSVLPARNEGPYDSTLWILFQPDWIEGQERAFKPYWRQRFAYDFYPEFVEWLATLVTAGCDPAGLDLEEFSPKSQPLREEDAI